MITLVLVVILLISYLIAYRSLKRSRLTQGARLAATVIAAVCGTGIAICSYAIAEDSSNLIKLIDILINFFITIGNR